MRFLECLLLVPELLARSAWSPSDCFGWVTSSAATAAFFFSLSLLLSVWPFWSRDSPTGFSATCSCVFGPIVFGPPRLGFAHLIARLSPPPTGVASDVTTVSLFWIKSFFCSLDIFQSSSSDIVSSKSSSSFFWCFLFGSSSGLLAFSFWFVPSLSDFVGEPCNFTRSLFLYTATAAVVTVFGESKATFPLNGFVSAAPLFLVSSLRLRFWLFHSDPFGLSSTNPFSHE